MYKIDIAGGTIKLLTHMDTTLSTGSTAVITSDGQTLYYNDNHAIFGMHLETGSMFLLCGSKDTFGKANGVGENARFNSIKTLVLSEDESVMYIVDR
jgi:hypothetical protein